MIYFVEMFVLQLTDRNRTINKLIVSSDKSLGENNNLMIRKGC